MKIVIKRTFRLIIALSKINWLKFFKLYNSKSELLVWIVSISPRYFFTTSIIWDLAAINAIIEKGLSFKILFGKNIGQQKGKTIIYTIHSHYNTFNLDNYTHSMLQVISQLGQVNQMFPPLGDANFWENKAFMHREFNRLEIPTPKTKIIRIFELDLIKYHDFPFLIKRIHSCESKGLYKIESEKDIQSVIYLLSKENQQEEILIQEILNMRKDVRVIMVSGQVVHHYWRINLTDKWRPTATSKGNKVDFENFPEVKRNEITAYFKKLNLTAGAFDIAWQNDDLSTSPMVLEVSPVFSPNPLITNEKYLNNYGDFKKKFSLNGYDFLYVKEIYRIKKIHLEEVFKLKNFDDTQKN